MYEIDRTQKQLQVCKAAKVLVDKFFKNQELMGKQGVNPLKSAIPPFLQMPFFISMFLGLRGTILFCNNNSLQFS